MYELLTPLRSPVPTRLMPIPVIRAKNMNNFDVSICANYPMYQRL